MVANNPLEENDIWEEIVKKTQSEFQFAYDPSTGVTMARPIAQKLLSRQAIAQAKERNGENLLWEGISGARLLEYDLIKRWLLPETQTEEKKEQLAERMRIIEREGHYDYPHYFGPFPPPEKTPFGEILFCEMAANGVFLIYCNGQWVWAIHTIVVETDMFCTYFECAAARWGEYLFYRNDMFALASYHLAVALPKSVENFLISKEALVSYIRQNYPQQMREFNSCLKYYIKGMEDATGLSHQKDIENLKIPDGENPDQEEAYFRFPSMGLPVGERKGANGPR